MKFHPRRLARQMAKAQLDRTKVTGYNKPKVFKGVTIPSRFSRDWKRIAVTTMQKGGLK
jgi:hypothetical protein